MSVKIVSKYCSDHCVAQQLDPLSFSFRNSSAPWLELPHQLPKLISPRKGCQPSLITDEEEALADEDEDDLPAASRSASSASGSSSPPDRPSSASHALSTSSQRRTIFSATASNME